MNAHKKCPVLAGVPGKKLTQDSLSQTRPPVVKRIGRVAHVSEFLALILANRGITPESEASDDS